MYRENENFVWRKMLWYFAVSDFIRKFALTNNELNFRMLRRYKKI